MATQNISKDFEIDSDCFEFSEEDSFFCNNPDNSE